MKITFIKTNKGKRLKENEKRFNKSNKMEKEFKVSIDNNHRINISDAKINEKNNHKSRVENNHKKNNEKIMEGLKVIFKKNQLVLLTLALMLITAGYMNYNNSSNELDISLAELGDAKLVSANIIENGVNVAENDGQVNANIINENNINETSQSMENELITNGNTTNQNEVDKDETEQNIVETTSNGTETENNNYFVQTRLERETMYSQCWKLMKKY